MKEIVDTIWNAPADQIIRAILGLLIGSFIGSLMLFLIVRHHHRQRMNNRNKPGY